MYILFEMLCEIMIWVCIYYFNFFYFDCLVIVFHFYFIFIYYFIADLKGEKISPFHDIPLWKDEANSIAHMIVEIPKGMFNYN
jgi:hypothetical protein